MCENYLISNHTDDIGMILESAEEEKCFSLSINFIELYESDTDLGNAVLTEPENSLKIWDKAAINVQLQLLKSNPNYSLKNNVHCRIFNLPSWPHVSRAIFPGNGDANKFLQITGIVLRISPRKLLEYQRQYFCVKCKFPILVEALYDKRNIIKKPTYCSNPDGCSSKIIVSFEEIDARNYKDYQEIKIQEDLSQMGVGTMPNHFLVTLEDDLVNICKPGENVTITGIVKRRLSEFCIGAKIEIDVVLRANHVQVNNSSTFAEVSEDVQLFFNEFWKTHQSNPLLGRNIILKSIAPEIYGLHLVKLAIAIVLAGGSQSSDPDSTTGVEIRSNPHLLLIGDPGTGKSQILKFVSKIIPRTVLTTGVGSTSAGLTVAALMENGDWQLEAGALVMADGGLCCIDEFNSMKEHDRHCIHEAMEQQTISVAKAGIVCKLNTRCTILAACNPKGRMDPLQSLDLNCGISSPLLSRFDLILLLRDIVNEDNDRKLAEYIMEKSFLYSRESNLWNVDKLQSYYALIRKLTPKLTKDAETILSTYYQLLRQFSYRNKSRTTVRLLESLIRLSQGHAKLMYHFEVYVVDALFAVVLTDAASDSQASFLDLNLDNNSFSDNPDQLYWEVLEAVLGRLNLYHIYEKEAKKRPPKEGPSPGYHYGASREALSSSHTQQPRMLFSYSQSSENPSTSRIRKPLDDGEERPRLFAQQYTLLKSQRSELPVQSDIGPLSSGHTQQPRVLFSYSQSSENPSTSRIRKRLEDGEERPRLLAQQYTLLKSQTSELPVQSGDIGRIRQPCDLPEEMPSSEVPRKTPDDSKDSGNFSRVSGECFNSETSINSSSLEKIKCRTRKEGAGLDGAKNQLESNDSGLFKSVQSSTQVTKNSMSLYEFVKSQCDMDLDLNIDFLYSNKDNEIKAPKKAEKRRSKPVKKTGNKCKKLNNREDELLKLLPSVNDDFSNIVEHIDWDLEETPNEPSSSTGTLKSGENCNNELSHQRDFSTFLSKFQFQPKEQTKRNFSQNANASTHSLHPPVCLESWVNNSKMENIATTSKCSLSSTSEICTRNTVEEDNEVFNWDLDDFDCPFESANPFAGAKLKKLADSKEDTDKEKSQKAEKAIVKKSFIFKKTRNMDAQSPLDLE